MVELRAPRRRRQKASHEHDYLPLIFVAVVVFVLGAFSWGKYQQNLKQRQEVARIEAANAVIQAENDRVIAEAAAAAERRRRNWERSQQPYGASGQRSFSDADVPPSDYQAPEKSVMQRQAEALAIYESQRSAAPQGNDYRSGNSVLAWAEQACIRYGTIEYRRCRANMSRQLIDQCRKLTNDEKYVKVAYREAHQRNRREHCAAADRYKIID